MAASGFSDKLRALQDRDKTLRENRERQTDIETARAVKGTCQDMCPEMERFFREETNQVSPLEMVNGKPDHDAMVKEYRRAGADQSEPLPHEMRPGPVLARTMDYLVCNILDRLETDPSIIGDWYDFLWSRTRAIRKDITQQHLCDPTSVDLMEKCVRFHIHCAATLVEEDPSVFDFKINDENLRKSMQSLKDFYHDLRIKNNIICPNEEEFRCYDILLNLESGDILREIKHLRRELRDSEGVQFAVSCHFALISNNYIKFFKLVRQTSYLNACLLHRYFNRIRTSALSLMKKSFGSVKEGSVISTEDFGRQLGFDDICQIEQFCGAFEIDFDGSFVRMAGRKLHADQSCLPPSRSKVLVEGKKIGSVGQVVHGSSDLPSNPYKQFPLHTSFQQDGSLKDDIPTPQPSPQFRNEQIFASPVQFGLIAAQKQKEAEERREKQLIIQVLSEDIGKQLITGEVDNILRSFLTNSRDEIRREVITSYLVDRLVTEAITHILTNTIRVAVYEENEYQRVQNLRTKIQNTSRDLASVLIEQVVQEETFNVCHGERSRLLKDYIQKTSKNISNSLAISIGDQMLKEIAQEVLNQSKEERERLVSQQIERRRFRSMKKAFYHWLAKYKENKRRRHFKESFPASSLGSGVCKVNVTPNVSRKRPKSLGPNRMSTRSTSAKKLKQEVGSLQPPSVSPVNVIHRSRSTDVLNRMSDRIALVGSHHPSDKLRLLRLKLQEEKERSSSTQEVHDTVTKAMIYLENFDLQG